ncbi:Hypothetical protein LUCI_0706 [Lucifera butyrica]|uniref:Uncharacterized protein n=1 Tax=Lucifera butyrica TaxID=1351585 RepID=A0A498QZ79_9FIRM|nr:DUF5693 family protein [Lucifera butyrica]VBB05496.1 Hypothetical protein LUCI_0706 [Lucifera butyrica]
MANFKYNKLLVLLIVVGLLAALGVDWQRHTLEAQNNQVELVMDYEDIVGLAQTEGVPVRDLMVKFREAGITTLAVYETTLKKLTESGKVSAVSGAQILQRYRTGSLSDPLWRTMVETNRLQPEDVYITGPDRTVLDEVQSDLTRRLSPERVSVITDGSSRVIVAKANYEKVLKWNLGLPSDEMREAAGQGFLVMPRPTNYTKVQPDDIRALFHRLAKFNNVSGIMFVGDEVLGYPDLLKMTAERMKEQNLTLAMIEHPLQLQFLKQDGLLDLASLLNYRAARVYVIPKAEQPKLKVSDAIHRWVLSDRERNIRIDLLRTYDKAELGKSLIETNLEYVAGVKKALLEAGFETGRAGTFPPFYPSRWLWVVLIFGATAAGVLLLSLLRPFAVRYQYCLLLVIAAVLSIPVLKGGGNLIRQAVALACAIEFPVLAIIWQMDAWRASPPNSGSSLVATLLGGLRGLTAAFAIAMTGGLYVAAILADVRFLLEINIYRGVKLTFIMPLLLAALAYLIRFDLFDKEGAMPGISGVWRQIRRILDLPIRIKTVVLFGVLAFVAWVYIGRSGHTAGVPVPAIEIKMRTFLENVLYARPREKEFMIGHPAFLLAVLAYRRSWPRLVHFALVVGAVIGLGSLVETFAHLRTPVWMSFVRGVDGLVTGAVLGILAVAGVQLLRYVWLKWGRRPAVDE